MLYISFFVRSQSPKTMEKIKPASQLHQEILEKIKEAEIKSQTKIRTAKLKAVYKNIERCIEDLEKQNKEMVENDKYSEQKAKEIIKKLLGDVTTLDSPQIKS